MSKIMVLEGLSGSQAAIPSREACMTYLKSQAKRAARGAGQAAGKGVNRLARKVAKVTERFGGMKELSPAQQRFKVAAKKCRGRAGRGGRDRSYLECMRQQLRK